jgi:hypothetical protein
MYRDTKKLTSNDEPWLVLRTVHIACECTTVEENFRLVQAVKQ